MLSIHNHLSLCRVWFAVRCSSNNFYKCMTCQQTSDCTAVRTIGWVSDWNHRLVEIELRIELFKSFANRQTSRDWLALGNFILRLRECQCVVIACRCLDFDSVRSSISFSFVFSRDVNHSSACFQRFNKLAIRTVRSIRNLNNFVIVLIVELSITQTCSLQANCLFLANLFKYITRFVKPHCYVRRFFFIKTIVRLTQFAVTYWRTRFIVSSRTFTWHWANIQFIIVRIAANWFINFYQSIDFERFTLIHIEIIIWFEIFAHFWDYIACCSRSGKIFNHNVYHTSKGRSSRHHQSVLVAYSHFVEWQINRRSSFDYSAFANERFYNTDVCHSGIGFVANNDNCIKLLRFGCFAICSYHRTTCCRSTWFYRKNLFIRNRVCNLSICKVKTFGSQTYCRWSTLLYFECSLWEVNFLRLYDVQRTRYHFQNFACHVRYLAIDLSHTYLLEVNDTLSVFSIWSKTNNFFVVRRPS